jgi:hypothetical protein
MPEGWTVTVRTGSGSAAPQLDTQTMAVKATFTTPIICVNVSGPQSVDDVPETTIDCDDGA